MICRVLIVTSIALILAVRPAAASDLRAEFEALKAQVQQGIGGYTGPVEPITEPIELRYGPHDPVQVSISHYRFIHNWDFTDDPDILQKAKVDAEERTDQINKLTLEQTITVNRVLVSTSDDENHTEIPSLEDASRRIEFRETGEQLGNAIRIHQKHELETEDRAALISVLATVLRYRAPFPVLNSNLRLDSPMFDSFIDINDLAVNFEQTTKNPSSAAGLVTCSSRRCALINLHDVHVYEDEWTSASRSLTGHLLLELPSLRLFSGMLLHIDQILQASEDNPAGELFKFPLAAGEAFVFKTVSGAQ